MKAVATAARVAMAIRQLVATARVEQVARPLGGLVPSGLVVWFEAASVKSWGRGQTPAGVVVEVLVVGAPPDAGAESLVADSTGGDDGERQEAGGDADLHPAVDARWEAEVLLKSDG